MDARRTLERALKRKLVDEDIEKLMSRPIVSDLDNYVIADAVRLYALTSGDGAGKKRANILACAKRNPKKVAILYKCALSLEPDAESIVLYGQIIENGASPLTMRLTVLKKMFNLDALPAKTMDVLLAGLQSKNSLNLRQANRLYALLENSKSEKAQGYFKAIKSVLEKKNAIKDMPK